MRTWTALAPFGLAMWVGACFSDGPLVTDDSAGGSTTGEPVCNDGAVTCPCYGNGTCDAGLYCQPDVVLCIPEDCMPGTLNCTCDGAECIAVGTECVDGLCQVPQSSDDGDGSTSATSGADTVGDDATDSAASSGSDATETGVRCPNGHVVDDTCARWVFYSEPSAGEASAGVDAADAACTNAATAAGLSGTYAAFLELSTQSAMDRTQIAAGDGFLYVKPSMDAPEVVADDGGDFALSSGGLLSPIDRLANGDAATALGCATASVFTGVGAMGSGGDNCMDWADQTSSAITGDPSATGATAFQIGCGTAQCAVGAGLYCVELVDDR